MKGYKKYYKLARPDGYDFYTGKTINYRENIGKSVSPPKVVTEFSLCTDTVLHASRNPNDCFIGAKIPCSAYEVRGRAVVESPKKCGFSKLKVEKEISDLDKLFGWSYSEVVNPFYPFSIPGVKKPSLEHFDLLRKWDSVRDSVRASVWDSVWASVWDSVRDSVWDSVWASVRDSVRDSVGAYMSSFFPNIKKWKYMDHKLGENPYQPLIDLWNMGIVPVFDGKRWGLHSGPKAAITWEGEIKEA